MSFFDRVFSRPGASQEQIGRLEELVGAPFSAAIRDYFAAVGAKPQVLSALLEWSPAGGWHDLLEIDYLIADHESSEWFGAKSDASTVALRLGDAGHGCPDVILVDPTNEGSPVWLADRDTGLAMPGGLLAASFGGFVRGLALPHSLSSLTDNDDLSDVVVPIGDLVWEASAAQARFDEILDGLVEFPPPARGTTKIGGIDYRSHLFDDATMPFSNKPRGQQAALVLAPSSLPRRFTTLVKVILIAMVLERDGGTMTDRLRLFSDDTSAEFDATDLLGRLSLLSGSGDIDDLALRFRTEIATPAAWRHNRHTNSGRV